jgi:hypothetical protein
MSKIKAGGVYADEPGGTTFETPGTHAPSLRGGNTKEKSKIKVNGVEDSAPKGSGTQFGSTKRDPLSASSTPAPMDKSKIKSNGPADHFIPKGKGLQYGGAGTEKPSVKNPPVKK